MHFPGERMMGSAEYLKVNLSLTAEISVRVQEAFKLSFRLCSRVLSVDWGNAEGRADSRFNTISIHMKTEHREPTLIRKIAQ